MAFLAVARRVSMEGVAGSVLDLVGNTPLVRLRKVVQDGYAQVLGKVESFNPGGSIKDRIALAMVEEAETQGTLRPGYTIVEATSGNSGIALAMVAAARGYSLVIFMPENAPPERRRLLARYGVDIRLTPTHLGMEGAYKSAEAMARSSAECVVLDVFSNPSVVRVHRETTGREIIEDTRGKVDAFVAGVGTGGTLIGVGERLKEENPSVMIVAVEPATSQVIARSRPGSHAIPGIGADFVPPLLDRGIIDEIMPVTDEEAAQMSLRLAREEGLLVGISSGANVVASLATAQRLGEGKTVVTVLADTGERYLTFPM
jgi:cysteine synthase A